MGCLQLNRVVQYDEPATRDLEVAGKIAGHGLRLADNCIGEWIEIPAKQLGSLGKFKAGRSGILPNYNSRIRWQE